jgi:hypothetical protein
MPPPESAKDMREYALSEKFKKKISAHMLIGNGADLTAQKNDGWTPLELNVLQTSRRHTHHTEHGVDLTAQNGID